MAIDDPPDADDICPIAMAEDPADEDGPMLTPFAAAELSDPISTAPAAPDTGLMDRMTSDE